MRQYVYCVCYFFRLRQPKPFYFFFCILVIVEWNRVDSAYLDNANALRIFRFFHSISSFILFSYSLFFRAVIGVCITFVSQKCHT